MQLIIKKCEACKAEYETTEYLDKHDDDAYCHECLSKIEPLEA